MANCNPQLSLRFSVQPGDAEIARLGLALDWRRVARRARRMFASHVSAVADAESQARLTHEAFSVRSYCLDASLFEELRECLHRDRAAMRKRRVKSRCSLAGTRQAATAQGLRAQRLLAQLSERLNQWEASALCGN